MGEKSELITSDLEMQLQELFQKLENEVVLKCVFDEAQKESEEMKRMVNHIAKLHELIKVEMISKEETGACDMEHLPLTMIYQGDTDTGISFHGVPGGQEINSFIMALLLAGGAKKTDIKIDEIQGEHRIDIMVSLACHHCAKQVIHCEQLAFLSKHVKASMYDARLYPDLVEKYQIERIPMTIIDNSTTLMGVKEIEEIAAAIK